jgi:hypothetical protein
MAFRTQRGPGYSVSSRPTISVIEDIDTGFDWSAADTIDVICGGSIVQTFSVGAGADLFNIVAASLTTGTALEIDDMNALTSGKGLHLAGSATAMTSAGRLLLSDHTGATSTSGILNEFKSAANDETVILKVTGTSTLAAGVALDISAAAMTTGKAIDISDLDLIDTGKAIHVDATGVTHTSGILVHLDSAGTVITGAGRIFLSDHTGVTTTSGTLNEFKSAGNDETILLKLTAESLTTGTLLDLGIAAALTTGVGIKLAHTTSVIADTGSLVRITSSSADTGGATNGTLLDVRSTGQLTGTVARFDNILTSGTGISVIGTGVMLTTGNLLTLTANSATTAAGILRINCNAITDGIGAVITSSSGVSTATGRLLRVDHTGTTTASGAGIIAEVASAATDATTILKVTASSTLISGAALQVSGAAITTGTGIKMTNLDLLTTGNGLDIRSNAPDTGTRALLNIINDNTAATGCTGLAIQNDATAGAHIKLTGTGILGIDFTALGANDFLFDCTQSDTGSAAPQTNAAVGFIRCKVGGTAQYIPYYNAT